MKLKTRYFCLRLPILVKIRAILFSVFQISSTGSEMLISDYLGKYWSDFAETFTEYVKSGDCNFPHSPCVKMKKM